MNIWFTSDTHYGHKNIAGPYISSWKSGYRNFESLEDMNKTLVHNLNELVKEDDTLYHLGDWSFGGVHNILKFRNLINCKNIHLILGNHDQHIRDQDIKYFDGAFNPIKLFSSVKEVSTIRIGDTSFFLSHYSHRVWNKSHHGTIHLYGHSHASIPDFGKSMDVGVDAAYKIFGQYRPFHLDEIRSIMSTRKSEIVDHHV